VVTEKERRILAYHEAGHAVMSHLTGDLLPVHKVTIVSRGQALGYTLNMPNEERYLHTAEEFEDLLKVYLAGRAAEQIVFGRVTNGAANDLEKATEVARAMVFDYGMSEASASRTMRADNYALSEETKKMRDSEQARLTDDAYSEAVRLLEKHRAPLDRLTQALLEKEARVVVCEDETEAGLAKAAVEAQGILFRIRPNCSASLMAACKQLRVVGRHGVGLDTVDIPAATRLGVAVVHAPGSNSQAVAEHALMLMLASVKRTLLIDKMTRAGDWGAKRNAGASEGNTELAGKTLGIVGVGNIGRRVAKFAGAIGMRVLGYDKYVPEDEVRRRGAEPVKSLEALLPQVDVLTCHTPLTPETKHMINAKSLALLKPGAIYVNTSRGPVQDERALFEALTRGRLGAAGLDVWEEEPTPRDNPLLNLENVVCSSHVAGVTREANRQMAVQVAGEMLRVLRGQRPEVLVNPDVWPRLGQR